MRITLEQLHGVYKTQLAASTTDQRALTAELRITADDVLTYYVVKSPRGTSETRILSQAVSWFNRA